MNQQTSSALKQRARRLLLGNYTYFVGATLQIMLINLLLGYLSAFAVPVANTVFSIVLNLLVLVAVNMLYTLLTAGLYLSYLGLAAGLPFGFGDLFSAFRTHPEPIAAYSVLLTLVQTGSLYLVFWLYFSAEHFGLFLLSSVVLLAALLWFELTYAAVFFFYVQEPQRPMRELMRSSRELMHGHRLRLLRIQLSFLGVMLLGILSLGIGLLYVTPYRTVTETLFFLELSDRKRESSDASAGGI